MKLDRILALTDLSSNSRSGLQMADLVARRTGAKVVAGYVYLPGATLAAPGEDPENARKLSEWARGEDEQEFHRCAKRDIDAKRLETMEMVDAKSARDGIAALVAKVRPALVCMSTHGRTGLKHALLGSVAEYTLRAAGAPVLVVKSDTKLPPADKPWRVLVALDLMAEPEGLLRSLAGFATEKDELSLAHVVESYYFSPSAYGSEFVMPQPDVPKLREAAEAQLKKVPRLPGLGEYRIEIGVGRPTEGILSLEEKLKPHVIVARTHGRRGFDRMMLGSVSEHLARRCKAALLVFPKS